MRLSFALLGALALFITACYPLSVSRAKWRIKKDKKMLAGKEEFLTTQSGDKSAPNIVLIICDDLGKYEVSAYGVDHIHTPNIDRIGEEGVVFEHGYVTSPTCAPSRAGINTGRVQNRYGFETQLMEFYPTNMVEYLSGKYLTNTGDFVLTTKPQYPSEWQVHKQGIPPSEITLSELLKHQGYATGITGKWHLGVGKGQMPLDRGFDYQYGFMGAFSLYTPEHHMNGIINHVHNSFSGKFQWDSGRHGQGAILENEKEIVEEDYLTYAIRDRAIDFIRDQKDEDQPFYLYCAFSAPHVPFQAPVDYYCLYEHVDDQNKRVYYSMISALDDAVGAIQDSIAAFGIERETMVILISDNGGASYTGATENGPLKGGKLTQFEGGINVPFMMKWPGVIPAGTRYKPPVLSTDIFVTAAAACGADLPADRVYDGVNIVPYVTGEIDQEPHPLLFWRADHIWALRDGDYKLILSARDGWAELYNLEEDISESINLKEDMPSLFEDLKQQHLQWQQELPEKPLWPRVMDHKFILNGKEYLFPA